MNQDIFINNKPFILEDFTNHIYKLFVKFQNYERFQYNFEIDTPETHDIPKIAEILNSDNLTEDDEEQITKQFFECIFRMGRYIESLKKPND